jgi:hypothetical protein
MRNPDIFARDDWSKNYKHSIIQHHRECLNFQGQIFIELIKHFGIVAGKPGGEDTLGRSILDLQTPEEIIDRARTLTKLAARVVADEQWTYQVPSYDDLVKASEKDDSNGRDK